MPHKAIIVYNNIISFITKNFAFFVSVLLLLVYVDIYRWIARGFFKYLIYIFSWDVVAAFSLTLILTSIDKIRWLKGAYKVLIYFILVLFLLVDFWFWVVCDGGNYFEIPVIVQNTNFGETSEFLSSFASVYLILGVLAILSAIAIIGILVNRISAFYKSFPTTFLLCICVSILLCLHNSAAADEAFVGKLRYWIATFTRKTPDFKEFYSDPKVAVSEKLPTKLVVIVGESFSKLHSSLYGYNKCTNPRLGELAHDDLFLFNNVNSPALSTLYCFQEFMNDHHGSDDSRPWEKCLTIHEVFSKAGYRITWLSNQNRVGFLDNVITAYANLSDDVIFANEKIPENPYDERVLTILDSRPQNDSIKELLFVHLMGSHHDFKSRYPDNFKVFDEDDYMAAKPNQRKNLSYYDNSILYNDYIVSEIIRRFEDKDACVVYFSDHGLDFYYTNPDYAYYGKIKDAESVRLATQIPFMVYLSNDYKVNHADMAPRLSASLDRPFNTSNLLYVLMDIVGIRFADNNDVVKFSPLR